MWRGFKSGCGYWNFKLLFVCLFTCLFVPHVLPISQKENGPIMIPKTVLKSGLWRRSESGCGIFNLKLLYFSLHSIVQPSLTVDNIGQMTILKLFCQIASSWKSYVYLPHNNENNHTDIRSAFWVLAFKCGILWWKIFINALCHEVNGRRGIKDFGT